MIASILRFDYSTLQLGRLLTDQQLWCLGCDVRNPTCVIERFGWTYEARADKTKGCGRLLGQLSKGGHLSMWGFGFMAFDTAHGALWLDRRGFRPRGNATVDPKLPIVRSKDLPPFRTPETADQANALLFMLGQLAERMEQHEHDILTFLGAEYRRRCLAQWKFNRTALDPGDIPKAWGKIAHEARRMYSESDEQFEEQVA